MEQSLKIIHIDDDDYFIDHFKNVVSKEPTLAYQQGFNNVNDAYEYLKTATPDIIFVDIEMPKHDGFWLAERLKPGQADVVFVTSHAGYALKAFEACAIDYLLKPVTEAKLQDFLERYHSKKNTKSSTLGEQLKELMGNYMGSDTEKPSRIFINTAGKVDIVNLEDVLYFSSKGNFTEVVMKDGTKYSSGKNIKTYEEAIFKNSAFLRIHRSIIVNKSHVKTILKNSRQHRFAVVMTNNDELEISFLRKEEIMEALLK